MSKPTPVSPLGSSVAWLRDFGLIGAVTGAAAPAFFWWHQPEYLAACGAIETIMSLYMMEDGFIAPTINLEEIDERCAIIKHVQKVLTHPVKTTAVQNFAFGGVNTILILRKFS